MSDLPQTKKSLGQHWLTDAEALKSIVEAAEITAGDTVLEIGPGVGTLTKFLTEQAKEVVAVELDASLVQALPGEVPANNLTIIHEDILKFDLTSMPAGYKVVANIPYYLTSKLVRVLSETFNPPACAVLLVQREVAERVAAGPGEMSLLSVSAQFYWEVNLGRVIEPNLFSPPPKVDSQVLVLQRRGKSLFNVDEKQFFRVVKAGFSNRRKTLLNSLSGGLQRSKPDIQVVLAQAGLDPNTRPQELSLEQWRAVYEALQHDSPALLVDNT